MAGLDVLALSNSLRSRYFDYLLSTHILGEKELPLRKVFEEELARDGLLSKGPLLSMLPTYETGYSARQLLSRSESPCLHDTLKSLERGHFDLDIPLYTHQIRSLELSQKGLSVVVATGTGSGKTECFLIPVLDDLARNPSPGVRCIVVYPMNALANDKLSRLRGLLRGLPAITFGRYTGETPKTRRLCAEEDLKEAPENERVSRDEIQDNPPHILLTNFAMLEYLLIRPKDVEVFRDRGLKYIVLDEAHTYTGAQGIDVSFLVRRVCSAFAKNEVQFFLTSATLADGTGEAAAQAVAKFATTLTGRPFGQESVIFGNRASPFRGPGTSISSECLLSAFGKETGPDQWRVAFRDLNELEALVTQNGLPALPRANPAADPGLVLHKWIDGWPTIRTLYRLLSEKPRDLEELAAAIFGASGESELRATEVLLVLGSTARPAEGASSLLPIRFHSFFRGLNGASICLDEAAHGRIGEGFGRLFLEDRRRCDPDCDARVFPLSSCAQCGLAMYVVREAGGQWSAPPPSDLPPTDAGKTFALATVDAVPDADGEDDELLPNEKKDVCLSCGRIDSPGELGDICSSHRVQRLLAYATDEGHLNRCPRCGAMAGRFDSVLRQFRTGDDAATAVLAEELMRGLPADPGGAGLPVGGRRLLAFSDSRQRAAFFAPYLARTSIQSEFEPPLIQAVMEAVSRNGGHPVSAEAVAKLFESHARGRPYCFVPREGQDSITDFEFRQTRQMAEQDWARVVHDARIRLWSQLCRGPRQRKTWSGVGLIWQFVEIPAEAVEQVAGQLKREVSETSHLLNELLRYELSNKAILFDTGPRSISSADLGPGPRVATLHFNVSGSTEGRRRFRWTPYSGERPNPRRSITAHIAATFLGVDVLPGVQVATLLETVWDVLRDRGIIAPITGGEFQIPERRVLIGVPQHWWACLRCGRLTANNLSERCFLPRCKGNLQPLTSEELELRFLRNHYRERLKGAEPFGLVVKEHTAQLENTTGRDYQRRFVSGHINVLSTSTTFEMGVDVGSLEAVLLRNVPPTPANYVQRAGRAGRRRSGGAVAVTFCRPLPHDQVHFHQPLQAVAGIVPLPRINLANTRLLQRHLNSLLLGAFLRTLPVDCNWNRVGAFFLCVDNCPQLATQFDAFAELHSSELLSRIAHVIPSENVLSGDEAIRTARETLVGSHGVASREVTEQIAEFDRQELDLFEEMRRPDANAATVGKAIQSVRSIKEALLQKDLIGFLADAHWLPSYAFPQDNVRLLVRQQQYSKRMRLERDRELGISEYAPGSEVIADGLLFQSRGVLKRGKAFRVQHYRYCASCRQLGIADGAVAALCGCGGGSSRGFIEPDGFQTSVSDRVVPPNLFRQRAVPNTEIFLVGGAPHDSFVQSTGVVGVWLSHLVNGRLFRANQGLKGGKYRLCLDCGVVPERAGPHQTAWGTRCSGQLQALDLGHVFETDTLQLRFDPRWNIPDVTDRSFWRSFSTGFLNAAAENLNTPERDMGATYRSQAADVLTGELVLYDRVPGGAGYVQRIIAELASIFRSLLKNTKECANPDCDIQGSCYVCLRSYRNQFEWPDLSRKAVVDILEPGLADVGLI